ncbi:ROK family transcriptional regulator [Actinoallomurus acanthiterrae]
MRGQNGDTPLARRLSSTAVLKVLHETGAATLTELANAVGVSRPTAEGIVEELLDEGLIEESFEEPEGRQRGRPAKRFRFRASSGHVIGVDIGAYKLLAMAADLGGRILATHRVAVSPGMRVSERLEAIVAAVEAVAKESGLTTSDLSVVGFGTTGVVDGEGRVVKSVAMPEWTGLELQARLDEMIAAPVLVENDIRLAILAEHWLGAAQDSQDVVYLFTGNRIGLGLLIGGRPYRGAHAASGELGEQPHDHWRGYRHVMEYAMSVEPGELRSPGQAAEFTFEMAREGDAAAVGAVEAFAGSLANGLITIVTPLDPELVVIGGGLSKAGDLLVDPIQRRLGEVCLFPPGVVASRLGDESIALGAVKLALDHVSHALLSPQG